MLKITFECEFSMNYTFVNVGAIKVSMTIAYKF